MYNDARIGLDPIDKYKNTRSRQCHMGMDMFILFFIQAVYLGNGMLVD